MVRYFKGCGVAPFEGMVNRGAWPELPTTSCVRSLPLTPHTAFSQEPHPSPPAALHQCTALSQLHLLLTFYCCFNCLRVTGIRSLLSVRPIDGVLSLPMQPRALQAGRGQGAECFYAIVNKKKLPFTAQFIDKEITYWN